MNLETEPVSLNDVLAGILLSTLIIILIALIHAVTFFVGMSLAAFFVARVMLCDVDALLKLWYGALIVCGVALSCVVFHGGTQAIPFNLTVTVIAFVVGGALNENEFARANRRA